MPRRDDIHKILIIGAGPIVIGQGCEFDYSGTQACKALKAEGYEVVLVNSNPATIMTDPEIADHTYIEPVTADVVAAIIAKERPDALLPTLGGQTGLNTAIELDKMGALSTYNVELIGASLATINKAEDRELFRQAMSRIGLRMAESRIATTLPEAQEAAIMLGFPVIIRPAFTLGGTGGGVAYNPEDLNTIAASGLHASLIGQVLVEQSVLGWKEYELEVMRDKNDNVVIICSIENLDPMGVHTGDSITVAPAQTLSDHEYQKMRNAAISIMREIGVDTGGSNVQFAVNPQNGEMLVVEMNPRVSRSSALASKATGFPIAKIAALLAVGFTLDEIKNDITGQTMAAFEPALDYCVVKTPRFAFEKFPETSNELTTVMKSVGEAMALGRTFKEALQKCLRSLETGRFGLGADEHLKQTFSLYEIKQRLATPNSLRIFYLRHAFLAGMSVMTTHELTRIDPWFLNQIQQIVLLEQEIAAAPKPLASTLLKHAKSWGFSDRQIAHLSFDTEDGIASHRKALGIRPTYKIVDTCAGEFEAHTPYYYSTYETECEARPSDRQKVIVIGGGPNRIGQGIEFDYCCVHASQSLREEGVESIMINSNPETVSTDYDTSDKLYFEPLTLEDVLHIVAVEKPSGVIVQLGGQTPLNLAMPLSRAGVPILGTKPDQIARAEDRGLFQSLLHKLKLLQPSSDAALSLAEALKIAARIGYPVLVRPSFVLGGRAMKIVQSPSELEQFAAAAFEAAGDHSVLIDQFLDDALEVDVDGLADGTQAVVVGVMEHIEAAGIHSGDSACVLPPQTIAPAMIAHIESATRAIALELQTVGLINIQFAVRQGRLYVLEANPRASRTVPFVSKATGVPLCKLAVKIMLGRTIADLGLARGIPAPLHVSVKEAVLPFKKFPGVDTLLGPEMKSTGEVMGIADHFGRAFAKAQLAAGHRLPVSGRVFLSVADKDKRQADIIARSLAAAGFDLVATAGTARYLSSLGIGCRAIKKVSEGRPNVVDAVKNNEIRLIINTEHGRDSSRDGYAIRRAALAQDIPYATTLSAALAMCLAIESIQKEKPAVCSIQEYHRGIQNLI
ncbi:MAG: carbamoyl phosphate synthase large subunit [Deltaproteobacteria bacterium HGW-Deltaproteobacteria-12]|jgi:carbamoyl-phosphate synthase large subunit|nr:MAG: carbamoyl phosphate synthase large subunit [Deltaproteobacteria bacterium HGW-Deltaproteobacteria-12]